MQATPGKKMKRIESKKSYSWWWDSHISPVNSKWLGENLEGKAKLEFESKMALYKKMTKRSLTSEMDRSVKRMLKLIEEEGDSFAKKAEMYYQKRPELISHVEEFYRMYRSLAERYDNLTGELRKNIPSDLQSQGSGMSENGFESPSTIQRRLSRRRSGPRAAGFEYFLGAGGGTSDISRRESEESSSSSSSSESESDGASSKHSFFPTPSPMNGDREGLGRKIIELEVELRDVKEKLRLAEEENSDGLSKVPGTGNYEELLGRVAWYEEELKTANDSLQLSEEKVARLKVELRQVLKMQEQIAVLDTKAPDPVDKVGKLEKQLTAINKKLEASMKEIGRLKLELNRSKASEAIRHLQSQLELENSRITGLGADVIDGERSIEALEEEQNIENNKLRILEEIASLTAELEKNELVAGFETVSKIEAVEKELALTNKMLEASEEEVGRLKLELEKHRFLEAEHDSQVASYPGSFGEVGLESETSCVTGLEADVLDRERRIEALEDELHISNNKLHIAEGEIARLKVELEKNETLVANSASLQVQQKNRISDLQEQISRLETNLVDRQVQVEATQKDIRRREAELEMEKSRISDLQEKIRKLEDNVSDRELEIDGLKITISESENKFSVEKCQLQEVVSGLSESCSLLEARLQELELKAESLKEEVMKVEAEKSEIQMSRVTVETGLKSEIEQLKTDIAERSKCLEELNKNLDALRLKYDMLMAERDNLNAKVLELNAEVGSKDDRIRQMDEHANHLHMEHVELISRSEGARKLVQELELTVKELEEEVDRQRVMVLEGAEEKREAIRQLCFSLEHYRNGYHQLRQAFLVQKRLTVMAS